MRSVWSKRLAWPRLGLFLLWPLLGLFLLTNYQAPDTKQSYSSSSQQTWLLDSNSSGAAGHDLTATSGEQSQIEGYIRSLVSDSWQEREDAKAGLLAMGDKAKAPLVAALWDLITDRRPRFSPANQKEGAAAVRHYEGLLRKGGAGTNSALERISPLQVNEPYGDRIIDLLVQMKSAEAVHPLIAMLWQEEEDLSTSKLVPEGEIRDIHLRERTALEGLGPVAVPALASEMENALIIATLTPTGLGLACCEFDIFSGTGATLKHTPCWRQPPQIGTDSVAAIQVQQIIAVILGAIGDVRAVGPLERVAASTSYKGLAITARTAIKSIRKASTRD
ncbi:MAG TPA: hypothetical protein VJX67_09375 [Blastocatellia bacterium]|nr:hypothetical protein [Blastocatellia bacterium]